jgi:hypothetical protein
MKGTEPMKTTLQKELSLSDARDTVVLTETEARAIRTLVSGIRTQMDALESVLESCGISSWISKSSPRSLANFEFTIERNE